MRRSLVVANWKMNGSIATNRDLLGQFLQLSATAESRADVAVCPPAIYLSQVSELLSASAIAWGAQDVSSAESGAYTGEISGAMLAEFGCRYVIIGHSERRQYHAESDALIAAKFAAVQKEGLTPILCVGETLKQREANETLKIIETQLQAVIDLVGLDAMRDSVVAYEPVWAIGTGLTASPEQAQEVHLFIRKQLGAQGAATRIIYGGSVKPSNAAELFSQQDIDGALVGGASLNSQDFYSICQAA